MEFPEHGGDAATSDGLRAASAKRSAFSVIMGFTVGHSLVIEERTTIERLSAILQFEIEII
jgi:hypothetical protein